MMKIVSILISSLLSSVVVTSVNALKGDGQQTLRHNSMVGREQRRMLQGPGRQQGNGRQQGPDRQLVGAGPQFVGANRQFVGAGPQFVGAGPRFVGAGPQFVGLGRPRIGPGRPWIGPAGGRWMMMGMSMSMEWRYWRGHWAGSKKGKKSKKSKKGSKRWRQQWRAQPWGPGGWGPATVIGFEDDYDEDVLVIDSTYVFDAGYGDCSTYAPFNENFDMCENDIDEYGIVAAEACYECGICIYEHLDLEQEETDPTPECVETNINNEMLRSFDCSTYAIENANYHRCMTDEDAYGVLAAETCPECGKCVPQNRKPVCVQRTQSSIIDPQPSMPFTGQNTRTRSNGTPISSPNPSTEIAPQVDPTAAPTAEPRTIIPFDAGYGDCSTYAPGNVNHLFCDKNTDANGVVAESACAECGKCSNQEDPSKPACVVIYITASSSSQGPASMQNDRPLDFTQCVESEDEAVLEDANLLEKIVVEYQYDITTTPNSATNALSSDGQGSQGTPDGTASVTNVTTSIVDFMLQEAILDSLCKVSNNVFGISVHPAQLPGDSCGVGCQEILGTTTIKWKKEDQFETLADATSLVYCTVQETVANMMENEWLHEVAGVTSIEYIPQHAYLLLQGCEFNSNPFIEVQSAEAAEVTTSNESGQKSTVAAGMIGFAATCVVVALAAIAFVSFRKRKSRDNSGFWIEHN